MFFSFLHLYVADTAHAIEFKPLAMKNTDDIDISTGIIGEPIVFHHTMSNDEDIWMELEIMFSTYTHDDTTLDGQTKSVTLEPGETKTVTYQFVPPNEENYITSVSSSDYRFADSVSYPALDITKDYQKEKVTLYSDSSDEDCLIACTKPSEMTITVGTLVEWTNTSPATAASQLGTTRKTKKESAGHTTRDSQRVLVLMKGLRICFPNLENTNTFWQSTG